MFPLFESIKVRNGKICNAEFHNQRIERAFDHYFQSKKAFRVEDYFNPSEVIEDLVKFRIAYSEDEVEVIYLPYHRKPITSLKAIQIDEAYSYAHKYSDRQKIDSYFSKRAEADDILMIKNNLITDTSYANIIFKKNDIWYTPKQPLLAGTQREKLIQEGNLQTVDIHLKDVKNFESFTLINALNELGEMPTLPVDKISFD